MNARAFATHLMIGCLGLAFGFGLASWRTDGPREPLPSGQGPALASGPELEANFTKALRTRDAAQRAKALAGLLETADPEAAPRLRERLVEANTDLIVDETVESLFAHWWAAADPQAAFEGAVHPRWADRHPWMRAVFEEWTRRDPIQAASAVFQIPKGPVRGRLEAARAVIDQWLAFDEMPDPIPVLRVIQQLEPIARGGALQHLADSMIEKTGLDPTLDFIRGLRDTTQNPIDKEVQNELVARTVVALLERDPELAKAWAAEHSDTPAGIGVHRHLAYYWGIRDGVAAMEWARALPDEKVRPAILKRAWVSFGRKHPDEARVWLQSQRPDEVLAGIYARHLSVIAESDPVHARELAERAEDESIRLRMRTAVATGWMKKDPEAAQAWLDETSAP